MIHRIYSSLPTFKNLDFHAGLNVLIAQKEARSTNRQTRNRAGKTSLIEIIHFLTGADAGKDSLFRTEALLDQTFGMTFDLGGESVTAERRGKTKSKLDVQGIGAGKEKRRLSNSEWIALLGEEVFGLSQLPNGQSRSPTFRSLFAYFVRRQHSGAFTTPEKQAAMQQVGDYQMALLYLLDLDWLIASDWQAVRDREKTLKELRKAAGAGAFGNTIGKSSDLRTQVAVAEAGLRDLQAQLAGFRVL
jgi:uncharacterized protein YydD (DUF2326 family)